MDWGLKVKGLLITKAPGWVIDPWDPVQHSVSPMKEPLVSMFLPKRSDLARRGHRLRKCLEALSGKVCSESVQQQGHNSIVRERQRESKAIYLPLAWYIGGGTIPSTKDGSLPHAYSIRESLQGVLSDFIRDSNFNCVRTEEIVRELVGLLAVYREEDHPLFPEVFVFSHEEGLRAIAPSAERIVLGISPLTTDAAETCLKTSAMLAGQGWAIYLSKMNEKEVEYGLFRSVRHAFSTSAEEAMAGLEGAIPVLLIRNRGHLVVELRNSKNRQFSVTLRTVSATQSSLSEHAAQLSRAVTAGIPRPEALQGYVTRLLTEKLQASHGSLIAVVNSAVISNPAEAGLDDGVWLAPPISLADRHVQAQTIKDANGLADLQAAEFLLGRMISSDGVVIFGTQMEMLGFRVFLHANSEESGRLPEKGGGRRRTYELMKLRMANTFEAALFLSQDGECGCERRAK